MSDIGMGEKKCRCFRTDANKLPIWGRKFSVTIQIYFYESIKCKQNSMQAWLFW